MGCSLWVFFVHVAGVPRQGSGGSSAQMEYILGSWIWRAAFLASLSNRSHICRSTCNFHACRRSFPIRSISVRLNTVCCCVPCTASINYPLTSSDVLTMLQRSVFRTMASHYGTNVLAGMLSAGRHCTCTTLFTHMIRSHHLSSLALLPGPLPVCRCIPFRPTWCPYVCPHCNPTGP